VLAALGRRASGSDAVTVLINTFTSGAAVPEHTHEVEEVLLVTAGEYTVTVDGRPEAAKTGDAVIIKIGDQSCHQPQFWPAVHGDRCPCLSRCADRRDEITRHWRCTLRLVRPDASTPKSGLGRCERTTC
jgi:uncharacterized cupin superfamily protein